MKKIIAYVTTLTVIAGSAVTVTKYQKSINSNADEIAKEVVVEHGNITAGVTESASVNVESLEQTYDLTLTNFSISASIESGNSSSGGMSMGSMGGMGNMGSMNGMGGMGGMSSKSSTSVTADSDSSSVVILSG